MAEEIVNDTCYGVCFVPECEELTDDDLLPPGAKRGLILRLPLQGRVEGWETLIFQTRRSLFWDYQPTGYGFRAFSTRLRRALDEMRGPLDEFQWLPALIVDKDTGAEREYWILHFPSPFDYYLRNWRTLFKKPWEMVQHPIDMRRVVGHEVFTRYPGSASTTYVTSRVASRLQELKYSVDCYKLWTVGQTPGRG